jgi:hypothetical protein
MNTSASQGGDWRGTRHARLTRSMLTARMPQSARQLEDQDECQPPRRFGSTSTGREERSKILISVAHAQLVAHGHIAIAMGKAARAVAAVVSGIGGICCGCRHMAACSWYLSEPVTKSLQLLCQKLPTRLLAGQGNLPAVSDSDGHP